MSQELNRAQWASLVTALIERNLIEHADDARPRYDGRDMLGAPCIGFVLPDDAAAILRLGAGLREALHFAEIDASRLDDWWHAARTDDFGSRTIVYFDHITIEADAPPIEEEEEEEEEED